ncbi:MAG: 50S ribosomal protein L16 [Conexivisphaera sp.]|uniref:LSU ribosomal protein L10e n=1 Tax=Conexivisphaera calida TaxID=1874277 RepID=A0A4P2VAR3_9ARCH|nr:50S ribosomal protein L16 [Conexivisphaera calida]MDP7982240.1 50S ribosomal protein L16 [Conexivisphaerales archaeon]BBE41566.1 LSU ribosomal protein L10e [Conexivisphaera calida]
MKGSNYRVARGMPYARREYVHGSPQPKVSKFTVGNPRGDYDFRLALVSKERAQIRHNALEAARVAANKTIETIGEGNYYLVVKVYPHVILRENKMIATAGADRLQEGMRRAFGKPVGLAARVDHGTTLLEIYVKRDNLELAKRALNVASSKLPVETEIEISEVKPAQAS